MHPHPSSMTYRRLAQSSHISQYIPLNSWVKPDIASPDTLTTTTIITIHLLSKLFRQRREIL